MKKSQTVINTLNLHHAIPFHASRTFPIARLNVTDVLRRITHVLKKDLDLGPTICDGYQQTALGDKELKH